MKREFNPQGGFVWVDSRATHEDVVRETQKKFEPQRDEQLKALMLQVEKLSKEVGVSLHPKFEAALNNRAEIMADHKQRKSQAEPN